MPGKRQKKIAVTFAIILCMALTVVPSFVFAAPEAEGDAQGPETVSEESEDSGGQAEDAAETAEPEAGKEDTESEAQDVSAETEEAAAVLHQLVVIWDDVTGHVGVMSLSHVVDQPFQTELFELIGVWARHLGKGVLGRRGQIEHLLLMGESGILHDLQRSLLYVLYGFHDILRIFSAPRFLFF